jgi:hypothetical protein
MHAPQPSCTPARKRQPQPEPAAVAASAPVRRLRQVRDFGVGYGNSSGYASPLRFTDAHVDPLFRLS